MVSFIVSGEKADDVRIEGLLDGKPSVVASLSGFTSGTDYAFASPGDVGFTDFLFYKPGTTKLFYSELAEVPPDAYSFGLRQPFDLGQPIQRVVTIAAGSDKSFIVFGQGETAGLFQFHRGKSSQLIQALSATNSLFTCALGVPNGFIAFTAAAGSNYSSKYQIYLESSGKYVPGAFGTLPTLADNDNVTIPEIYSRSVAANSAQSEKEMKPYTNTIPGTQVTYSMVPIPSGEFVMGSPKNEAGRKDDESPQHKVKISPFWMGQYEVTWNEYELFMFPDEERRTRLTMVTTDATGDKLADAVTHPSRPYVEMSFGMGKDNFPAISMTQHGANKYCQWLSAKTGHFYRLPTEAEWEYAARAGTTTTYFFGDDKKQLGDYAWFEDNSDFKYQKIGKKKPNPWGLYDIYGNVVEWVLDQYDPNFYKECATKPVIEDPLRKATKPYPHSVRGGSWDDPPEACRSAARRGSDKAWKATDPQLPKSIWYLTDAQWVGFRIVRPLKVPPPEQMQKYWNSGVEKD
ncbi:MAG: hypothetical protein C5B50_20245 [Verrucomicrobia bacterium]|nr:MAG: hypothetical protein C5B50_20245 [Verrucomicrobiota bacterium]